MGMAAGAGLRRLLAMNDAELKVSYDAVMAEYMPSEAEGHLI